MKTLLLIFAFLAVVCSAHAAAPIAVASNFQNPSVIAQDDSTLFVVDNIISSGQINDSRIERVEKSGGSPTILATGLIQYDSGQNRPVSLLYSDGQRLVAMFGGYVSAHVVGISKTGGPVVPLINLSGGYSLGASGGLVYYGANFNTINSLAVGGASTTLATGYWSRSNVLDPNQALFFVQYPNAIKKLVLSTRQVVDLASNRAAEPGDLAINSSRLYFDESGVVYSMAKVGGPVTSIATPGAARVLGADDDYLFVSVGSQLIAYSTAGGAGKVLALAHVNGFAMDQATLYWTDTSQGAGLGVLYKMPKPVPPTACAAVEFIGARGSGEPTGLGTVVSAVYSAFKVKVPGATAWAVPYDAVPFNILPLSDYLNNLPASILNGAQLIMAKIRTDLESCPSTRFVVSGYSQGAAAVAWALQSLDASALKAIAGVGLIGDPQFYGRDSVDDAGDFDNRLNGAMVSVAGYPLRTFPSMLKGRVISDCAKGDVVCNYNKQNLSYCLKYYELCPHFLYATPAPIEIPATTLVGAWLAGKVQ